MKNIILITARLKSTRLPRKVLRELVGRPMLSHLVERMKRVKSADGIVVCTSPLEQDEPLQEFARRENVGCFTGDPVDVLVRLRDCANAMGADNVFSCTGDNPLTDALWADRMIERHMACGAAFTRIQGLPIGSCGSVISVDALNEACMMKAEEDTEIWGSLFTSTGVFDNEVMQTDDFSAIQDARLTVDTPEDFTFVESIVRGLGETRADFDLYDVQEYLIGNPQLKAINAHVRQATRANIRVK